VLALGAVTGNQAVQQVKAGLQAVYVSGWQVAADANNAGQVYPDQSLYPADSVPRLVRSINQALVRADQIPSRRSDSATHWFAPLIADAEAGFGGNLNAFELMKAMIEAGAACVHFEDQVSSLKKVGRLGGNVLAPANDAIQKLVAARLASDVLGIPTLLMARTDAISSYLLTSDIDPRDREFLTTKRTSEGFIRVRGGVKMAIARALAYAPTPTSSGRKPTSSTWPKRRSLPKASSRSSRTSCSPIISRRRSTGRRSSTKAKLSSLHRELAAMGYKFQFITIAGFHALNMSMFDLARNYKETGPSPPTAACKTKNCAARSKTATRARSISAS